jgi:hypothetical protein
VLPTRIKLVNTMKRRNRLLSIALILAAFTAAAAAVTFKSQDAPQNSNADRKVEREEPTLIQEGQATPRQREHGKLFKHPGPKLLEIAARRSGDIEVQEGEDLVIQIPTASSKRPLFLSAVCNADAVVIGTLTNKVSQLTAEGTFVFTDHDLRVEEVIKNNSAAPIELGNAIGVTRDGGIVELNHRILRARPDFEPPLVGNRYLLFLRFIPVTGSYLMYGNGAFELNSQSIKALGSAASQELLKADQTEPSSFIQQIRAFGATDCGSK